MRTKFSFPAFVFFLAGYLTTYSYGAISITGDVNSGTGVVTISDEITFDITSDGNAQVLVFDEWGDPQDGTQDTLFPIGATLTFQVNGVDIDLQLTTVVDNLTGSFNQITPNDAFFSWSTALPVQSGDVVTIKPGSWALPAATDWNPATSGFFQGNVFLTSSIGIQLSSSVNVVPEPNSALLSCCLGFYLLRSRRRKQ
jgi:hypothetical protein